MLDSHTVAYADWPGNNRIESLRNLEHDDRVGMVFLFPGLEIFMRINGRGSISTDPALLARLSEGQRTPKTATVVRVEEVLFHCGKAINRAHLWEESAKLSRDALPTIGRIMAALSQRSDASAAISEEQVEQIDSHYDHAVKTDLY